MGLDGFVGFVEFAGGDGVGVALGVGEPFLGVGEQALEQFQLVFQLAQAVLALAVVGLAPLLMLPLRLVAGDFLAARTARGDVPALQLVEGLHLALGEEVIDIAGEGGHLVVLELIDFGGEPLEEVTVVGDEDEAALVLEQGVLEHVLGGHVEVVGGLVEDKQVEGREQQFGQCQSCLLAAGEHAHLLLGVFRVEEEAAEDGADFGPDVAHGHIVDGLEDRLVGVQQLCLVLGVVADHHLVAKLQLSAFGGQ